MNFSVQNAERMRRHCVNAVSALIREPIVKQIMRISVVSSVLLVTSLQLLLATTPGRGQGVNDTKVTLELKNASLETALRKIETLTDFRFVYRTQEIREIKDINLDRAERTLSETLAIILESTSFTYREMKKNILIVRKEESISETIESTPLEHKVSGKVVDENSEPLAGVSIVLKGTSTGTTSGSDGNWELVLPEPSGILMFSFIGFATQEVAVDNRTTIDVTLIPDVLSLTEVVVTALGISREERSLGYATQEVKGENVTYTKEQNVINSLAGKVAGVQVIGSPGASMGGTSKIKIRGVNTLSGSDGPLIVLDGTPMSNSNFSDRNGPDYGNAIQDINPDDIESINVLKGPAASALYGLRGQHGVVMITTKKGSKQSKKIDIEYSGAYSVERAGNFMPNQNLYGGGSSQSFGTLTDGTLFSSNSVDESWGPKMDGTMVRQYYSWFPADPQYGQLTPYVPHPNNVQDYYEQGNTFNNTISVSGGGANSTFRLSYNNTNIRGVEPNTWLKRNNFGFNGSLDVLPKLKVTTSLNYANNEGQRPPQGYDYGSTYLNQWFQRSVDMKRLKNYKYSDGTFLNWNIRNPTSAGVLTNLKPLYWNNPYFDAYESFSQDSRDRVFGNVALNYEIVKGLSVSGTIRTDMFTQNIDKRTARGGREAVDGYRVGKYQNKEMNYEFIADYKKEWGELSFNAIAGGNLMKYDYSSLVQATVGGLVSPGFYSVAASVDRPSVSSTITRKEIRSLFAMTSFGYKNTWFLDASIRRDYSSALPENNNAYYYPSVSASMVFSELVGWEPMTLGKLRLSYATAGADLQPYLTTQYFSVSNPYMPPGGATINSLYEPDVLFNPNLNPTLGKSYEGGVDLKFLNNRVGLSFTAYHQQNENQVLTLPVSGASGYTSAIINAGLIENKGFELALSATPVQTGMFNWDVNFNIARNRSMVKELYDDGVTQINNYQIASNTYSGVTATVNARVNEAYGTLVGQAYMRDAATGKIMLDASNLPMYEANHNFGSVLPDYTGGMQNTLSYGPLTLNAMIDFQIGGQFFSWSKMLSVKTGMAPETAAINENGVNVREPLANGGGVKVTGISSTTGEEVTAFVDARTYYRSRLGTQIYEEWLYDASYVRLREVRLGYSFTKAKIGKLPFNSATLSLIARNPLMIYQKAPEGLNPAELANGSEAVSWLETGQLITVRSYGVSLNIKF
jgi:TonB-linked SusC/RagA family outer membrane protein